MITLTPSDFQIAARVQDGLSRRVGKQWAITSKRMIGILKAEGFKNVNGAKIREIIHFLRTERKMLIIADAHGYYMATRMEDVNHQVASLNSRIREMEEVKMAMIRNSKSIFKQQEIEL